MELVYLWVEDYKNIHRQGFNFSPRFECKFYNEYDEEGNLKENCQLVICDKKKGECLDKENRKCKPCEDNGYIENFFGENINITAIVGKNGSGKSSVLKLIREIIDNKVSNGSFLIFYNKADEKYICIYTGHKIHTNVILEQSKIIDSSILFPMFDYSLTYDNSINYKNSQLPIYPKKSKGNLSFYDEMVTNQINIIINYLYLKEKKQLDKFENFFQLDKIKIFFNLKKLKPFEKKLIKSKKTQYKNLIDSLNQIQDIEKVLELIKEILILTQYIIMFIMIIIYYKKNYIH